MRATPFVGSVLLAAATILAASLPLRATRAEQNQPTSATTGTLNIHITGARADLPVVVQTESRHGSRMDTVPPGRDTVTFTDLELGANYVSATQEGLVSGLVEVILDTPKTGINVHLELDVNHAELVVPVHDATVRALRRAAPPFSDVGVDLQPRTPGRYELSRVQPGTPLLVQAEGFAPVSRRHAQRSRRRAARAGMAGARDVPAGRHTGCPEGSHRPG